MRISLLTDGIYPYVIGGMQKHSFFLVKFFAQNKVFVDLYHNNSSTYDISKLEVFTDEEKKYIRSFVFDFPKTFPFPGHYNKESYLYSCDLYSEFLKHDPPDFIYAKGYTGWKFMEEKKKGKTLPPIGVRLHGYEVFQATESFKVKIWNLLYTKTFNYNNTNADYVYSYGGKITDIITKNLKISTDKIISIPTGIESSWLNEEPLLPKKKVKFIFVGRYDIRKGIKELNEALNNIKELPDFEFYFIGPIPDQFKLTADNIHYLGQFNNAEEIKKQLQNCDVLVLPSHSEGMPNVIMEAMASGCAIIATDVGAIHLMVDESNGWLIPALNPEAIANAIKLAILLDSEHLLKLKKSSVQKVKNNFLWEHVIQQEITEIQQVIDRGESK